MVNNLPENKDSIFQKIKNLFVSRVRIDFKIDNNPSMLTKWNWYELNSNSSDHMPILGKLIIEQQNSKIYEVLSSIGSFFTRL